MMRHRLLVSFLFSFYYFLPTSFSISFLSSAKQTKRFLKFRWWLASTMEPSREDAMFPTILRSAAQAQHVFDCLQLLPALKYEAHLSYSYSYPVVAPRASTVTSYQLPIGSCSTSATQIDVLAPWQRRKQTQDQRGANVTPTVTVPPLKLEKLSSRASFLTFAGLQDATNAKLSREVSFPSAGSIKRSREHDVVGELDVDVIPTSI